MEENVEYKGRRAHRIRWLRLNMECYIDPATHLPIVVGDEEITYEEPPPGTFDVVIPDGYVVVDTRPGEDAADLPEWRKEERDQKGAAQRAFNE